MNRPIACIFAIVGIALGATLPTTNGAETPAPSTCTLRLTVELTPDVPNASDPGFLSSLLGNNVGYRLTLMRQIDDTTIDVRLDGPGTIERCQAVVDRIQEDGRVLSIEVQDDS